MYYTITFGAILAARRAGLRHAGARGAAVVRVPVVRSARYACPYTVLVVRQRDRLRLSVVLVWFCAGCGSDHWLVVPRGSVPVWCAHALLCERGMPATQHAHSADALRAPRSVLFSRVIWCRVSFRSRPRAAERQGVGQCPSMPSLMSTCKDQLFVTANDLSLYLYWPIIASTAMKEADHAIRR